jgi:prepilin-type N-terminal cleavage/methylation domain-containing protein
MRKAFTMIELIFVIIILGIISSIGSEIIANIYQNYILQRATYRASLKTELAAQQIANYLTYRIPGTTIARNPANVADNVYVTDPTVDTDNTHILLEWIGTDNDGFSASLLPAWNGFCDVNSSDQSKIITPGSNLALEDAILSNLSNGEVNLAGGSVGGKYPAIFFKEYQSIYGYNALKNPIYYQAITTGIKPACMGMVDANTTCISSVGYNPANTERLNFQLNAGMAKKLITEHYKLAWTAYSIMQFPKNNNRLFDLKLCYNYQPWEGERISNNNGCPGTLATIATNISVFKFAELGNTFRFKICAQEDIGEDYNVSICKEKAVIL